MTFSVCNNVRCCIKYELPMDAYCIAASLSVNGNFPAAALSLVVPKIRFQGRPEFYIDKFTEKICLLQTHLTGKIAGLHCKTEIRKQEVTDEYTYSGENQKKR